MPHELKKNQKNELMKENVRVVIDTVKEIETGIANVNVTEIENVVDIEKGLYYKYFFMIA